MNIFQRSLHDYLSIKFLGLSLATLLVPLFILGLMLVFGGSELFAILSQGANSGDFSFINEEQYPILSAILKFSAIKWLVVTLFYTIGGVMVVLLSLIIAIVVLGFLTPIVVKTLHKKYYKSISINSVNTIEVFETMGIVIVKFILLFIVCLPFVFIPFVIHIPFFYIFYKFMSIDIGSNMMSKKRLEVAQKRQFTELFLTSLGFFILSLIPIVGIFLQLFFAIYFTHFYFQKELIAYGG